MPSITNLITIRIRIVSAMLATVALTAMLASTAVAGPAAPAVPDDIKAPAGSKLFLVSHAVGEQIYTCSATATGFEWRFVAPRADLYGANGKHIGTHGAGPNWTADDGSSVRARRVKGVNVDPTAIDWLLLERTTSSAGIDGDRLTGTTAIQRINTVGGLAPAASTCTGSTWGAVEEVPYEADYAFYKGA